MGSSTSSFLWGSGNDNVTDPATGLTGKQKKIIQSTWAIVKKDSVANGVAVMIALFKKHPEYQQLFKAFKDLPLDDLAQNNKFKAHCQSIMSTLSNVVEALNDPQLLEATLSGIGERHRARGQTKEQFLNLKVVILDVLRQKFGSKFTAEVDEAWTKTLDAAFAGIIASLEITST